MYILAGFMFCLYHVTNSVFHYKQKWDRQERMEKRKAAERAEDERRWAEKQLRIEAQRKIRTDPLKDEEIMSVN